MPSELIVLVFQFKQITLDFTLLLVSQISQSERGMFNRYFCGRGLCGFFFHGQVEERHQCVINKWALSDYLLNTDHGFQLK